MTFGLRLAADDSDSQRGSRYLVESRTGAVTVKFRFQPPLIAPDVRISRIRRSDEAIMLSPTESCASSRKAF